MSEEMGFTGETGPVTFERPMQRKQTKKQKEINSLVTWMVRGALFLAEVLFFLPLCVVSCSSQPNCDKAVNGFRASFGFELSYLTEKVVGIWWLVLVFILTAVMIAVWYIKDMNRLKDLKLRKLALCFLTGVFASLNVVLLICFLRVANARVEAANAGFAVGEVTLRYTLGFWVLFIIQLFFALGGLAAAGRLFSQKYLVHKSK